MGQRSSDERAQGNGRSWATLQIADAFATGDAAGSIDSDQLLGMVRQIANQVDRLTGLVQGQDSEGGWMGAGLSDLVRPGSAENRSA